MNKVFMAGAGILLVLGLTSGSSEVKTAEKQGQEVLYDFEKESVGTLPAGWMPAETGGKGKPGTWKVVEKAGAKGGRRVLALAETANTGSTFNLALKKETLYREVKIALQVMALSGKEDRGGGPVWRAKDANNYYLARWNPLETNFRVYFVKDGKRKQLASAEIQTDPDAWHKIAVEMKGNKIIAYFDDKKTIEVEDATFAEAGMIGLWTKADASSAFDDIRVTPLLENNVSK